MKLKVAVLTGLLILAISCMVLADPSAVPGESVSIPQEVTK